MENEILDISNESISSIDINNEQLSIESPERIEENLNNNIDNTTNCLALTIKQDYPLIVVKNFFKKSFKVTWKVALSIITINFLNLFL